MTVEALVRAPPSGDSGDDRESRPFLSVVVATRNDNHGGDPLFRTQAFINCLQQQCIRFDVPTELIVVEWNPPEDRPRLAEVLEWPEESDMFSVRIIEVGEELHRRIRYSDRLPLFQMIAKNVGIRRARGRWIVATNIDIIFSDELMEFLASGDLDPKRFYRLDRHDVVGITDAFAPVEEQLRLCKDSVIRINGRYGTKDLETGEFYRVWLRYAALPWWAAVTAQVADALGRRFWRGFIAIPRGFARRARALGSTPARALPSLLWGRIRLRWHTFRDAMRYRDATGGAVPWARIRYGAVRPWRWPRGLVRLLRYTSNALVRSARRAGTAVRLLGRAAARPFRALGLRLQASGREFAKNWNLLRDSVTWARALPALHTNACGDFTLLSREAWFELRAYPELHMFSMFIDSMFVYMAHWAEYKEEFLPYPIYHIEHDHGFRPDAGSVRALNERIDRAGIPQIDDATFRQYAIAMFHVRSPLEFNDEEWGFANDRLPETNPAPRSLGVRMKAQG